MKRSPKDSTPTRGGATARSPLRQARAEAMRIELRQRGGSLRLANLMEYLVPLRGGQRAEWTRAEVDCALNDLVERGLVRLEPDSDGTIMVMLRRA
jgi:hypothetical protein